MITTAGHLKRLALTLSIALGAFANAAFAQEDGAWDPIPASEWEMPRDSAGGKGALMLFEKVVADERDLDDEKCYVIVHRRIKLFSREVDEWADVHLEYDPDEEKLDQIEGRTVLRDGRTVALDVAAIHDKEMVRTEGESMREKFFSLPGIEDTCIIEYRYRKRSSGPNTVWIAQKNIPVMRWEYRWLFYDPKLSAFELLMRNLYFAGVAPNYFWVNSTKVLDVTMLPTQDDPKEVVFRVSNIPAFADEPITLPDEALKAHLRAYYSSDMSADYYWSYVSVKLGESLKNYFAESDDVKPVVDSILALPAGTDRIAAAFDWVRRNIRLVRSTGNSEEYEEITTINEMLERRYGEQADLNFLFAHIVRQLPKCRAFLAMATDRSKRVVYTMAKYWQFERPVVGVVDSNLVLKYYSPGDLETVPGQIPWYYEGSTALVMDVKVGEVLFVDLPKSDFGRNNRVRSSTVSFNADGTAKTQVREVLTGHPARAIRLLLSDLQPGEQGRVLEKDLTRNLAEQWRAGLSDVGVQFLGDTVRLTYTLTGPGPSGGGGTFVVTPFSFLPDSANPFVAERRTYPIMFECAETDIDTLILLTGDGRKVDAKPQAILLTNSSGSVEVRADDVPGGVRIFARSILRSAIYSSNLYNEVKALVSGRTNLRNLEIVLVGSPPGE